MTELIDNLAWPVNTIMVSKKHRVLFTPIAKNACTSLKRLFVRLSGHPDTANILQSGVHSGLANGNTGLVLGDFSQGEASEILHDDRYYRFAVLRNPAERAVSGYINKFVLVTPPGKADGNPLDTESMIDWVYAQRGEKPDYDRAITFAEFVDSLVATEDSVLDTHFRSQHEFLAGQDFDELFSVEKLDRLKPILEEKFRQPFELERANSRTVRKFWWKRTRFEQLRPKQLQKYRSLPETRLFITPEIKQKLESRFKVDVNLWNATI